MYSSVETSAVGDAGDGWAACSGSLFTFPAPITGVEPIKSRSVSESEEAAASNRYGPR